jgi:hypothetical protein
MIKTDKDELKIFASEQVQTLEEIINGYTSRIAGERAEESNESILIRQA